MGIYNRDYTSTGCNNQKLDISPNIHQKENNKFQSIHTNGK